MRDDRDMTLVVMPSDIVYVCSLYLFKARSKISNTNIFFCLYLILVREIGIVITMIVTAVGKRIVRC